MTAYQKAPCEDGGLQFKNEKYNINIRQNTHHNKRDNTHHNKRDNTTLHKERPIRQQHYKGTGRDPDADMGGRWLESLIFIIIQGAAGQRMVVDRQIIIKRSESRKYRVAGRLEVRTGSVVRQAGSE
jgi:hypothetical protein